MPSPSRILTVDDDPIIRQVIVSILKVGGYQVLDADNGPKALEQARQAQPDLILLDVTMPGMDGRQVAQELKKDARTRAIPIIMLTGLGTTAQKVAGLEAGADEYLTKPVSAVELLARVRAMLRLKAMHDEVLRLEKERHDAQLAFAREVQTSLLPASSPPILDVELAVRYQPCEAIGGDFYDFLCPSLERLYLILGDAEGHGVSAAILMARAGAYVRATLDEEEITPAQLLAHVNRLVSRDHGGSSLLPMLCVSFDLTERVIRYANAGHEFPILIQPSLNRWEYLESTGPMLGVNPSQPYSEQTIPLHEQDILVCHTDGLSDAIGQDGQPFGRQRIESTILGHKEKTVQELADLLGVAWSEYAGDRATDDMTLVVARCLVLRGRSPA